jgi:putative endonuclease
MSEGWVYILCGRTGTLYTGATTDLDRRVREHRKPSATGFASKYDCHRLVYQERLDSMAAALKREKLIKGWTRAKKLALIRSINPQYRDLALSQARPEQR